MNQNKTVNNYYQTHSLEFQKQIDALSSKNTELEKEILKRQAKMDKQVSELTRLGTQ
jgi:hypothetical protein